MLLFVIRKMLNNKWMVICLLIGSILSAAMICSIPLYTNGILQRMLTRDLENSQKTSSYYPGYYYMKLNLNSYGGADYGQIFNNLNKIMEQSYNDLGIPAIAQTINISADLSLTKEIQGEKPIHINSKIEALIGFENHIKLIDGRMYTDKTQNEGFEVIVSEEASKKLDVAVGRTYSLKGYVQDEKIYKLTVVGIFAVKDETDVYWFNNANTFGTSFVMDYSIFSKKFVKGGETSLTQAQWYYALDYTKITLANMKPILNTYHELKLSFVNYGQTNFKATFIPILEQYYEREKQLKTTLWILEIPIMIMLAFYIFMVSQLIIDHEKNEIAVLKSRGASRQQVFISYLVESLILSAITLILGPPLGVFLCKIMGSSNGFLEFVQRKPLKISLNWWIYLYAFGAVLLFIVTMLIPAFLSSRISIVEYKRSKSRNTKNPIWQRFYLDLVLLAVAVYGFYRYNMQKKMLIQTGIKGTDLAIDPILFLTSTFFILGAGLLFLRLYPYLIRLIFWLGRKVWSPVLYASFIQVGRSKGQEQFLMLFLIFTLSIGIFSANAARTINKGVEDKAVYEVGSDIAIRAVWESDKEAALPTDGSGDGQAMTSAANKNTVHYVEPYFLPYTKLSGIENATKVFRQKDTSITMPTAKGKESVVRNVNLMGIIPHEFGKVAWFRNDLLPYHINEYLNLMTEDKTAFLLSRSFEKKYSLKAGDSISISWAGQGSMGGTIYGFIDYWPTYNPFARKDKEGAAAQDFVVTNLSFINDKMALEPYEVWLKKSPGVGSNQVYQDLLKQGLAENEEIKDSSAQIIEKKNDPILQGTNGSLTLGFILTIAISTVGFLIYWILSIKKRLLQFGIFRALGLTKKDITGMLICEQILISGTAVIMGIVIGKLTSNIFIRLFEIVYSAEQQILPFKVVEFAQDYVKLYSVMGVMLIICLLILIRIISTIKIYQVIKLGED